MRPLIRPQALVLCGALLAAGSFAACQNGSDPGTRGLGGAGGEPDNSDIDIGGGTGGSGSSTGSQSFTISSDGAAELVVELGKALPSLKLSAATKDGAPLAIVWSVDRGDLATITMDKSDTATITATGKGGGTVVVIGTYGDSEVRFEITIKITGTSNGPDASDPDQALQIPATEADLTNGGGPGGVGGEGLGTKVDDADLVAELAAPSQSAADAALSFVYPYDGTVFPRGLLAPLVGWDTSLGDVDAIRMELSTKNGSFSWSGSFGPPAILTTTGGDFVQHPIPGNIWRIATDSAGGKDNPLTLKLTVAKAGVAYGTISQSWVIADARLSGTIYYNSYGTKLVDQDFDTIEGGKFGGATLGIRVGDTAPVLIAGTDSPTNQSGCRVCHSVSADGSRLTSVQNEGSATTYSYDLDPAGSSNETLMNIGALFPAITPDGKYAVTRNGALLDLPAGTSATADPGLADIANNLGTPMFSPDGTKMSFNPYSADASDFVGNTSQRQKLVVVDFDASTLKFSNPKIVVDYTGEPTGVRPGWPAFFPDGNSLIYHHQLAYGDETGQVDLKTRRKARAQIYWANLSGSDAPTPLNALNGLDKDGNSYLPALATQPNNMTCSGDSSNNLQQVMPLHDQDEDLNYEPTVNPVASGGYAWVVFTSRRRYSHAATIPPFCSDPRGANLTDNITPKKLWVAAVDLNAKPGSDASHPAFYLPGQELLAGNSRGFWVLDPCRGDGEGCESGDQCCNGFCQADADSGDLVCGAKPPEYSCSNIQEKCEAASDCCDVGALCIGGFCADPQPR